MNKFKSGSGNHMQPYNPDNGQYTNEDIVKIKEKDMENLVLIYVYWLNYDHLKTHFSNYNIHDKDYCDMFIKYIRDFIDKEAAIIEKKK